jgi:hypothetical protein
VTSSVRWTSPPNTTVVLSDLGENMELRVYMRQETIDTKVQVRLAAVRESHKGMILQSDTGEELSALLPSILDKAFNGEI